MWLPDPWMFLLLVLVFVPLERLITARPSQGTFRKLWQLDFIYFCINGTIIRAGISVLLFVGLLLTAQVVPIELRNWVGAQSFWLQLPAIILLSDLCFYAMHRLFHTVPWLWQFHAVHHSIEELDWLASHRIHFFDQILTKGSSLLPVFALGFSAGPIAVFALIFQFQSLFIHSNTKIKFGPLTYIFASPEFHHWHHANQREAYDKNYASQLSFLDILFGTYHMPEGKKPEKYGLDAPVPTDYIGQVLYPVKRKRRKSVKETAA
jgi:sterol desaturase/sphingolipid hydroxylase (fatty acid hydroxylase superfamily)